MIGIAAPARSGKDTVARLLLEQADAVAYALADPLKIGCQALFGLSEQQTWSDALKETPISLWQRSPREFFQQVGTDWMRQHNPDHWLMRTERVINPPSNADVGIPPQLKDSKAVFKLAAQAFFGLTDQQTWNTAAQNKLDTFWNYTPQQLFDLIEHLALRDYPDYWQLRAQRPVQLPSHKLPALNPEQVIIIKDIRFENEAAYLRGHNGRIWHIVRHDAQKVNAHSSEHGIQIAPEDLVIDNNGSLQQLANAVQVAWQHHCETLY